MVNTPSSGLEFAYSTPLSTTVNSAEINPSPLSTSLFTPGYLSSSSTTTAIAFVDAALPDVQTLVAGMQPGTAVYVLNPAEDEVNQITQVLADYHNLSAVALFDHGSDGALQLGNTSLNTSNLMDYAGALHSWSKSLAAGADVLLYGCDVAQDGVGENFVRQIASLTGADVAASTDLTGSSSLGGNWNLEFSTGHIEAGEFLSDWAQAAYQHLLATYTVTNTQDSGAGSLRDAIANANANPGADTINFSVSGTITLSSGALALTDSAQTTIDATGEPITITGSTNNAFVIDTGAVASLTGLTISDNLDITDGGGIENYGTMTVSNSTISGNSASEGGGVENYGTMTVSNSTISGNSASYEGGGIFNGNTMTVSNSIIAGNTAPSGREIYSQSPMTSGGYNLFGYSGDSGLLGVTTSTGDITPSGALSTILSSTLANNGGSTPTLALVSGSPAIDAGDPNYSGPLTTDQRGTGFARVSGGRIDIGAFELQQYLPPATQRDAGIAGEAGGFNNGTLGSNATGNVLTNETDPNAGGTLSVSGIAFGTTAGTLGNGLNGSYGTLTLNTNGTYTYVVDNNNSAVQALNLGQTLTEQFSYTAQDSLSGKTASDTLTITIKGADDAPVVALGKTTQSVLTTSTPITGISLSDVDGAIPNSSETVTLAVTQGSLTFGNLSGATATGVGAGTVTLSGNLMQLNAALATLNYSSSGFTGNAKLNVTANDGQYTTPSQAISLQVAQNLGTLQNTVAVSGSLSSTDPLDRYQFTLATATTKFHLTLGELSNNADVFILDSSGNVVASSTNSGTRAEVLNNLSLAAGTYFVQVQQVSGNTGYNLSFHA